MGDRPPRSGADAFAVLMGTSPQHAARYLRRMRPSAKFEELDHFLRTEAAVADRDAAADLNSADIADAAESDDPAETLREIADRQADIILRGRLGAYTSWSRTEDRTARTRPARDAFDARFEREVDPGGRLEPAERAKRAEYARKAYFARLALKSAQARRRKGGQ